MFALNAWPSERRLHDFLRESMNFHPDKQLFQAAGAGDPTTDPWITGQCSTSTPHGLTGFELNYEKLAYWTPTDPDCLPLGMV